MRYTAEQSMFLSPHSTPDFTQRWAPAKPAFWRYDENSGSDFRKSFAQENDIVSAYQMLMGTSPRDEVLDAAAQKQREWGIDPDYDPTKDPRLYEHVDWWPYLHDAKSSYEADAMLKVLQRQEEERFARMDNVLGFGGMALGAILTPAGALGFFAWTKKALARMAAMQTVQEVVLHSAQPTRTAMESGANVGGAVVLTSGLIGLSKIWRMLKTPVPESLTRQADELMDAAEGRVHAYRSPRYNPHGDEILGDDVTPSGSLIDDVDIEALSEATLDAVAKKSGPDVDVMPDAHLHRLAGDREADPHLRLYAFMKLAERVAETPVLSPVLVEGRLSLSKHIDDWVTTRAITPEDAVTFRAAVDAMPESFFANMKMIMRGQRMVSDEELAILPGLSPEVGGFYMEAGDLLAVFTESHIGGSKGRLGSQTSLTPEHIFQHEVGHRVHKWFTTPDEKKTITSLYEKFGAMEDYRFRNFLDQYEPAQRHKEFFAEEINDYLQRRARGDSRYNILGQLIKRFDRPAATALERVLNDFLVRVFEFARKFTANGAYLSERQAIDNFLEKIIRRGEKADPDTIINAMKADRELAKPVTDADVPYMLDAGAVAGKITRGVKDAHDRFTRAADDGGRSIDPNRLLSAFGLEGFRDSPAKRMLLSTDKRARELVSQLVEHPWFQIKHLVGVADLPGIDRWVSTRWIGPMYDVLKKTDDLWVNYKLRLGQTGERAISKTLFYEEVGKAMRRQHNPEMPFTGPPEAAQAAVLWRGHYSRFAQKIKDHRMRSVSERRELAGITARRNELVRNGPDDMAPESVQAHADTVANAEIRMKNLQERISRIESQPVDPNYLNRVYNKDLIRARRDEFTDILVANGRDRESAAGAVEEILRERPHIDINEDAVGMARSLHHRGLDDIPDIAIEKFLESDIHTLGRYYTMRMGSDVELVEQFGSVDMYAQIKEIKQNFADRIATARKAGNSAENKAEIDRLSREMDQTVEDIQTLRDRIRGTYGMPDDPDSWSARAIRVAKAINAVTLLTGALAAVPDIGSIVLHNGLRRSFGTTFDAFRQGLNTVKLAKNDAQLAGEALDLYLSMRAAAMADIGVDLGTASRFDKMLGIATQQFFNISGMNPWNVGVKTMASLIGGTRILEHCDQLVKGTLDEIGVAKLARVHIDKARAQVILDQAGVHGHREGKVWIARTSEWTDQGAKELYSSALGKDINLTIVTPGKGELPSFISHPVASLLFQFKSFTIAAHNRILVPGLQLPDQKFLQGVTTMVGLGMMVDHIRQKQIGRDEEGRATGDVLASAIERSGMAGWFADVNGALETLSDNRFGVRPLLGAAPQYGTSGLSKIAVAGGPIVQQLGHAARVMWGMGPGDADDRTADSVRRLIATNKVFWLDGFWDYHEGLMREVASP